MLAAKRAANSGARSASSEVAARVAAKRAAQRASGDGGAAGNNVETIIVHMAKNPSLTKMAVKVAANVIALAAGANIATRALDRHVPKDSKKGGLLKATASTPYRMPAVVGASAGAMLVGFSSRQKIGSRFANRALIYGGVGGVAASLLGTELRHKAHDVLAAGVDAILPDFIQGPIDLVMKIPTPNEIGRGIKRGAQAVQDGYSWDYHDKYEITVTRKQFEEGMRTGKGFEKPAASEGDR
jgi:hypothetical protein